MIPIFLPVFNISDEIEATLIATVGSVIGAVVTAIFSYLANRRAKEARDQITNGHPRNVRDDLDQQFSFMNQHMDEQRDLLTTVLHRLDGIDVDMRIIRHDTAITTEDLHERIKRLEHTRVTRQSKHRSPIP